MSVVAASMVACDDSENLEPGVDSGSVFEGFTPITEVVEYKPAPGQFVEDGSWNNTSLAFERLDGGSFLTLGGWGGFVVVSFGSPVLNEDGGDIAIRGNAFATSNEPGIVWVSADANENGECDDVWYELDGSESNDISTVRGYTKSYHFNGIDYTFSGTRLASNAVETSVGYWTLAPYAWGYVDNQGSSDIVERGYNLFDIDNAVDESGDKVSLSAVDFVKVQSAVDAVAGHLGEVSTEVVHFKARTK